MDAIDKMVAALKQGETVRLVLSRGESMQNAHAVFNRIEREHDLKLGRIAKVDGREVVFVVWADGIGQAPRTLNRRAGS